MNAIAMRKRAADYNQGDFIGDDEDAPKILHISAMNATGERILLCEQQVDRETYGDELIEYDYATLYMNKEGVTMYRSAFPGDDDGAVAAVKDFEARCTKHRVSMPLILG